MPKLSTFVPVMIKEQKSINLKNLNTFGIEVFCHRFVEFTNSADLYEIFSHPGADNERWNVLGGGSNILLTGDYRGMLLKHTGNNINVVAEDDSCAVVRADAGVVWDDFVQWAVDHELWGAENLSYIPGTVGATPVQNIGAYGVEAKDIIHSVECYDVHSGKMTTLAGAHCSFGYRESVFKRMLKGRVVITSVFFSLNRIPSPRLGYGDLFTETESRGGPTLANIRTAVTSIRRSKLPEPRDVGNAGSFFKNPLVTQSFAKNLKQEYPDMPLYPTDVGGMNKLAAGWLIDQCGWKGRSIGKVGVHERQALVLVNHGGATGHDILALAQQIQDDVRRRFGVDLEIEVNIW